MSSSAQVSACIANPDSTPTVQATGSASGSSSGVAFFDHFETVAEAEGGPRRLATLAISMGMRGLLGTGHPRDEPAEKLIARMKIERDKLIESGAARRRQSMEHGSVQPLFAAPSRWAWTRLGEVITVIRGASPRPKGDPRFFATSRTPYPWVKISDFKKHGDGQTLRDTDEFLTAEGAQHSVLAKRGTLLLTNSATIGVPIFMGINGYIHDGFLAFPHFPSEIDQRFFFLQLRFLTDHLFSEARGLAQLNLNSDIVRRSPLVIPPLAEQKRIVAKVDQLMALCDELEAQQTKKRENGARLTKSALEALTTAETPEDFDLAWTRVSETFDVHIDVPEKVGEIRRAIRDLAVSGRIALVGKTTRWNADGPFAIPAHWQWKPLGELVDRTDYGTSQKAHEEPTGVPVLRMNNIQDGKLDLRSLKYVPAKTEKLDELTLQSGDLLFNRTNSYELVGKMAGFDRQERYTFASYLIRVRPDAHLALPEYINLYFGSGVCRRSQIEPYITRQTNQANFNGTKLKEILVPTPSIKEQAHIVLKAKQLLGICDMLHAKLRASEDLATRLADALVAEAVE